MLILRGPLAYPHFRIERLLTKISSLVPQVNSLSAEFVHFIDLKNALPQAEEQLLFALLDYGCYTTKLSRDHSIEPVIIVVPMAGTISTWSSKATNIAKLCGLTSVTRIERGIVYKLGSSSKLTWGDEKAIAELLYDPEQEAVFYQFSAIKDLFQTGIPKPLQRIDVLTEGKTALVKAKNKLALTLSEPEINFILELFLKLNRNPSDVEFMTIAQFYSTFKPYKFFDAEWIVNNELKTQSLREIIQITSKEKVAIIEEGRNGYFFSEPTTHIYHYHPENTAMVISASLEDIRISGGVGESLQTSSAIGRGSRPKAGLCGFSTLNMRIPKFLQPWENYYGKPKYLSPTLEIILELPQSCAQFNNEFGRPTICGYFRTYEQWVPNLKGEISVRGYLNPLIFGGGLGSIRTLQRNKPQGLPEALFIVLGGPAMLIGMPVNKDTVHHWFSLQYGNPEMQRRCQEVINACTTLGRENPIIAIHSVGRGGLGNAILALLFDHKVGGQFECRDIPSADPTLSPLEIWCNEAQERYVMMIDRHRIENFREIALRESCPFAIIGNTIPELELQLFDRLFEGFALHIPTTFLFEKLPKARYENVYDKPPLPKFSVDEINIDDAIFRLLRFPVVADKSFLIQMCDRTVTGLIARDQMVGPWQIPVADCAVTVRGFDTYQGEAIAIGERSSLMLIDPIAGARMAIGEAITNIAAANIATLSDIRLVLNWNINGLQEEVKNLYKVIETIGLEFCPMLGITIAVNQDSEYKPIVWHDSGEEKSVGAPLSLVISAFAPIVDVRLALTPLLTVHEGETVLIFIDLSGGKKRLGGSAIAQVFNQMGDEVPDVDNPRILKYFFNVFQSLHKEGKILAYHDRSDGGLFVTLCEMAFASHVGLKIDISELGFESNSILFNEELGAVLQVYTENLELVLSQFRKEGIDDCYVIGTLDHSDQISITFDQRIICNYDRIFLQELWSETSFQIQSLRDNPRCAKKQYEAIKDREDPGLTVHLTFDPEEDIPIHYINVGARPRVAILREQGTHGHIEMAAAFDKARFECVDVHMNDLQNNSFDLATCKGLAVCGGFSFGDVLGAGQGWANRILFNANLKEQFEAFFNQEDTFTLGLSNGCQMLSYLKSIIPGATLWPNFIQNYSEQFEGRLCLVEVQNSSSIFLKGMEGSRLLVPVAHKEGRVAFVNETIQEEALRQGYVALRYVDNRGRRTKTYPANPNGSSLGITGLTSLDGRVLIMMPHPDRAFRTIQYSWHPDTWGEDAPWLRLFRNARHWVG